MADQKRITLYSGQVPQGSNIVDWTSGDRVTDISANNNAQAFYFDQNKTQPVPAGFLKQNNFGIQLSPEDVYAGAINPINLVMNKTLQEYTKNRLNGYYNENGNVNLPNSNVSVYQYEQALKNPYLYDWFNTYMPDTKEQYLKYIDSHPNLASRTPYDTLDDIPMTGNIQSPHFINGYAQMGLEADTRKNTLINDASMVTLPSINVPKINKIPVSQNVQKQIPIEDFKLPDFYYPPEYQLGRDIEAALNKLPPNPTPEDLLNLPLNVRQHLITEFGNSKNGLAADLQDAQLLQERLNKFNDTLAQLPSDNYTTILRQHPELIVNQTYGGEPMIGHPMIGHLDAITPEQRNLINQAKDIYKKDQVRQLGKNGLYVDEFDTSKNPYIVNSIKFVNPKLTNKVEGWKPFNSDDIYIKTQSPLDPLRVLVHEGTHGLRKYVMPLSEGEKAKFNANLIMHFQNKSMPFKEVNSRVTNMEKQFAEQAVPFSKEFKIKKDLAGPLEEQANTGGDIRRAFAMQISKDKDHLILGKELDDAIKDLTFEKDYENILNLLRNESGYGIEAVKNIDKMSLEDKKKWFEAMKNLMYYALGTTGVGILNNDEKAFGGKLLSNNNLFNNGGNSIIEYHPFNTQNKEHQEVGLQGLMKSTLANQAILFNNPTAKRILGYDNRQYVFKPNEISEEGGEVGNVYLGSYGEYVSPGIQEDENPNLHYVPSENMWDDTHVNNTLKQSFKFRNPEEADYFAEHYKEVSPYSMTNNDEYSPIKKLFDNDENNYSKGGSIRERAKEIRLKVSEKFKPVYDYLYNEDTEDNQYKRGGKVRRNTGESAFDRDVNTTLALDKYKKYDTPEWRAFLKSIAYQESSFRPNAKSIAGAIGFYQLMPYENLSHLTEAQKKSGNWNQTALMLDHIEQVQKDIHNRLNYATLQKAKMMGLNDYDLLAIAHFSGVGGLRKWLRHSSPNNFKEGAKDGYGMSQFGYLKKFRKGMAKYSNNPEKETITPFSTESPTFDYEKYTEAILNQGLARLNAQYSQNYQDLPTYGPTKQSENPFEIKQLQDNFSSPFTLPNQLTQQPIQSAFGGIINRDNPIQNYGNNPNIGLPTVRY